MASISRREAGKVLLAGCAGALVPARAVWGATRIDSVVRGVQIGAQSYSFRDRPLDAAIAAYREVGLGECELTDDHLVPGGVQGPAKAKLRATTQASYFHGIRQKFDDAGVQLYAFTYAFRRGMPDEELEFGFIAAQGLGVKYITSSGNVSMAPRVDPLAQKYKIMVGFHGHDSTDPDEFSTPDTFARAMKGASPYIGVNLDIGHFVAAGGDPVAYITEHHAKIVTLHLKDRKKNHGDNLPFGQGDTPIGPVLRLLRDKGWKIPANIEYEYGKPGMDTIVEMKKCYAYCRKQLES